MVDAVYIHRSMIGTVPELGGWFEAQAQRLPSLFPWTIMKYNLKTGGTTFVISRDFDTADEPECSHSILVHKVGDLVWLNAPAPAKIYHHKWLMVQDTYRGFNVRESKIRSLALANLMKSQRNVQISKIGDAQYWKAVAGWVESDIRCTRKEFESRLNDLEAQNVSARRLDPVSEPLHNLTKGRRSS